MAIFLSEDTGAGLQISVGTGLQPADTTVQVTQLGGTVEAQKQINVVTTGMPGDASSYTGISVQPVSEEAGINYQIAPDSTGSPGAWQDTALALSDIVADGAVPIWFRAVVDNDGSVATGLYTACKLRLVYTEVP